LLGRFFSAASPSLTHDLHVVVGFTPVFLIVMVTGRLGYASIDKQRNICINKLTKENPKPQNLIIKKVLAITNAIRRFLIKKPALKLRNHKHQVSKVQRQYLQMF
jgi:hypothetical protein